MQLQLSKLFKLLEKEMSREDFLKLMGLVAAGLIGLPQLLSLLRHGPEKPSNISSGYGGGPYGV